MSLFKSAEARRVDREIEVRRGLKLIRRNITSLEKNERDYLEKAKRAHRLDSPAQVDFLKTTIRRTIQQRRTLEKQLLQIETALQIKSQAESHASFARSLRALSREIASSFEAADLAQTQQEFELAMRRAETLEEQMEIVLDVTGDAMTSSDAVGSGVTDDELDRWIREESESEEKDALDPAIEAGLSDVRRALGEE